MNTRYCTCGKANLYEMTKPRFCGGCSKDLDATFSGASVPAAQPTVVAVPQPRQPNLRKPLHPATRQRLQAHAEQVETDDEDVNEVDDGQQEVQYQDVQGDAHELAASIDASSFVPSVVVENETVRAGSLQNLRDAVNQMQQAQDARVKKPRRKKGSV